MPELNGIGFDTNLASALSSRAGAPDLQKLMKKWSKSLTPTQKARFAAASALSVNKLKLLISQRLVNAPQSVKEQAASAVTSLTNKEALAFFLIDLEYGIAGSLPAKPIKVGKLDRLFGKSIKFGSPDGPEREGICLGPESTKKGNVCLKLLVVGEKTPVSINLDQVIAIGEVKVETETWTKEAKPHKFTSREANMGAEQVSGGD